MRHSLLALAFLLLCLSCKHEPDTNPDPDPGPPPIVTNTTNVAVKWGLLTLQTMYRLGGNTPTYGSRSLGYAGLTMYECVVNGSPAHRSLGGQLIGLTNLPVPETGKTYQYELALNAGQAVILKRLFDFGYNDAVRMNRIDSLERAINQQFAATVDAAVVERSVAYGKAVAEAIFAWSKTDGGYEGFKRNFDYTYVVPRGSGFWVPPAAGQAQVTTTSPLHPHWGQNRTFALANSTLPVPSMTPYSTSRSSDYYKEFAAVYQKNGSLSQEERNIAGWWADDPTETFSPPGHSYSLAGIVATTAKADLYQTAETYARVGMAVADAFINCWKAKYTYHCERPGTYIRANIDANWNPFWPEPPFPSFYSGHSVQSGATATVLEAIYGPSFSFTDTSHWGRPSDQARKVYYVSRSFNSFWSTAQEAAQSRFWGGIHTNQDNVVGLAEGKKVGTNINALTWRK